MPHFPTRNRSQNFAFCALCTTLCAVLVTCGCRPKEPEQAQSNQSAAANSLDRVTVGHPTKKSLALYTEQPARVEAFEQTPIVSKLAGYIESIQVDIGDKVTKDQTLIRIHAPEYKDQHAQRVGLVAQAEALVKQAEASVVAAEAAANSTRAVIAEAEAGIKKAEAEFGRWESESKRIQELAQSGTVTPKLAEETLSQFRSASASRDEALATLAAVKAKANEAEANVLKAKSDVDVAKAKLVVANSELAQSATMLNYMELKAPFEGVVTSRNVDVGHFVQPASNTSTAPLLTIANVQKVRVFVNVPESEANWINSESTNTSGGDSVRLTSPNLPTPIENKITRTSLQLNAQSHTLSVEIDVDNKEAKLLPGAFVTAKILLEERKDTIAIPISAVVKSATGIHCCAVVSGKIEHRPITLGLRVGDEIEVLSGLSSDDKIVLLRANSLLPGQSVELIEKK